MTLKPQNASKSISLAAGSAAVANLGSVALCSAAVPILLGSRLSPAATPPLQIAVEEALRVREAQLADEVVAVSIGPKGAADTLRTALAMGADRAVHIQTDMEASRAPGSRHGTVMQRVMHAARMRVRQRRAAQRREQLLGRCCRLKGGLEGACACVWGGRGVGVVRAAAPKPALCRPR